MSERPLPAAVGSQTARPSYQKPHLILAGTAVELLRGGKGRHIDKFGLARGKF